MVCKRGSLRADARMERRVHADAYKREVDDAEAVCATLERSHPAIAERAIPVGASWLGVGG